MYNSTRGSFPASWERDARGKTEVFKMQDTEGFGTGTYPGSGDESCGVEASTRVAAVASALASGSRRAGRFWSWKVLELKVWSWFQMKAISGETTPAGVFKGR